VKNVLVTGGCTAGKVIGIVVRVTREKNLQAGVTRAVSELGELSV